MLKEIEGIVIRQTKTGGGLRMVSIFTREEGKLSAGTRLSEKSKGDAALAIRPFSHSRFMMSETRGGLLSISSAETIDAHFAFGEDADRFAEASYALEFTDKLLPEGIAEVPVFDLLCAHLRLLAARKTDFRLLTISYMIKILQELGVFPERASVLCGDLISGTNDDIVNTIEFIMRQPLERMDALILDSARERVVFGIVKAFAGEQLELPPLKSERMLA